MAVDRPTRFAPPPPQRSHGYGALAFLTFLAMAVSIGLLVLEYSDYKFSTLVDRAAPVTIDPKLERTAPKPGG